MFKNIFFLYTKYKDITIVIITLKRIGPLRDTKYHKRCSLIFHESHNLLF